jgi:hypothetical protein
MMLIGEDDRFFEEEKIPNRPLHTSIRATYAAIAEARVGALFVIDDGLSIYCITERFLRSAIFIRSKEIGVASASVLPISSYLSRYLSKKEAWHNAIVATTEGEQRLAEERPLVIEVGYEPVRHDQSVEVLGPDEPPRIYRVLASTSHRGGYLITSRRAYEDIFTPATNYVCDDDHETTHWDSGQCPKVINGNVCDKPLRLLV